MKLFLLTIPKSFNLLGTNELRITGSFLNFVTVQDFEIKDTIVISFSFVFYDVTG